MKLLGKYPDVNVEIITDYGLTDIVAQRFDAGVRLGEQVDMDMIALRIGPDFRMAAVAAPSYFESRRPPATPRDLTDHACINLRLPTSGGFYAWDFRKGRRELKVRVQERAVFNTVAMMRDAALGFGIAYLPEDQVEESIRRGRLVRVLADWCPTSPRLSPLLSESPPTFASLYLATRSVTVSAGINVRFLAQSSPPDRARPCLRAEVKRTIFVAGADVSS